MWKLYIKKYVPHPPRKSGLHTSGARPFLLNNLITPSKTFVGCHLVIGGHISAAGSDVKERVLLCCVDSFVLRNQLNHGKNFTEQPSQASVRTADFYANTHPPDLPRAFPFFRGVSLSQEATKHFKEQCAV
jgi:hypothetical protein